MTVALFMDVHVPWAITDQLRRRGVDVLTAQEDGTTESKDHELLARCHQLQRLIFTQDIRFKALAEDWQQRGEPFAGLLFGHQFGGTIGDYVRDLELIAKASVLADWSNAIAHLPFA